MNIAPTSLSLNIANFKSQALGSLFDSSFGSSGISGNPLLQGANGSSTDFWSAFAADMKGLSATGRNMALPDPESAYRMMSLINDKDVIYKAQFSELSQMKSAISQMEAAGQVLVGMTTATPNNEIASRLQAFVGQYNGWVQRFDADMESGGLLAGTQAAQVARRELDQSIENIFNGANGGVHGLADLGLTIDRDTKLATLDTSKLETLLASNKRGAVDAVQQFSANFAVAANMLNSSGNFIPNQLDNLDRAIHYIADNEASLTAEFGTGDAARPTGLVAKALAAYNDNYGSLKA